MTDFRVIPSIEQIRQRPGVRALEDQYGRDAIVAALRDEVEALRARIAGGTSGDASEPRPRDREEAAAEMERRVGGRLSRAVEPSLRPVLNATGVIVHTNLGRAPLADAAARAIREVATRYANLEYDLAAGRRGARDLHAERLLCRLTRAEAAVVVNNNAAAALLILTALAKGREVVVSRGELVEIGGGFRVPDVMAQSGAILREVGTTNKTRQDDYAAAIGERTALILRVHRSNFRIEGFTEQPTLAELVALGRERGVPVVEDLGSGYLGLPGEPAGRALDEAVAYEPKVQASIETGIDLVCFSGDKLLGGPQAGIIIGRSDLVHRVRTHPLMRAVRVDKITYAALEATLAEYAAGRASATVPVARMIAIASEVIARRAEALAERLQATGFRAETLGGRSTIGGGAAPGLELATRLVAISLPGVSADALEARLRALSPPVVARIENDRVVLDLRTVAPDEDALLAGLLESLSNSG